MSKGISTTDANEGTCIRANGPFRDRTVFNVVDSGHTLHMPGFDVQLLASTLTMTPTFGPAVNSTDYPNRQGLLVSLEIAVTNRGSSPLEFDQGATDVELLLPANDSHDGLGWPQVPYPNGAPSAQLDHQGAIQPGATSAGWVSFVTPAWAQARLNARPADLDIYRPAHDNQGYIGQIRLWKSATAAGSAAISFQQGIPPATAASG